MSGGTYSKRNRMGHRKDMDCLRSNDREEMATRSRMLQLETNRRRKAQVVKRKIDVMKEERRRQEILMKRREQIREATERYQRLKKNYMPDSVDAGREQAIPALEEALHAIRSSSAAQQRQVTPANPRNQYSPRSADTSLRSAAGYYQHQGVHLAGQKRRPPENIGHDETFVLQMSPGQDAPASSLHARQLHNHSLRNLHASRNLFEQQLVQQQAMLVKQQHDSLRMFDSVIQEEMERDYYHTDDFVNGGGDSAVLVSTAGVSQCDSPSSVDSLEAPTSGIPNSGKSEFSTDSLENHFVGRQPDVDQNGRSVADVANTAFMQHSRSFSSPSSNIAVVMPCFVQHRDESANEPTAKGDSAKPFSQTPKEDRNNNNLGKDGVYVNGASVNRCDPFSPVNNGPKDGQFYQDVVINRVSVVNGAGSRNLPVSADQMTDWKANEADGYYNQMDNVWAHPLISSEMTQSRYHTSMAPLSTTATIEGGNIVYNHNQSPITKQAFCVPPQKLAITNSATVNSVVPKQQCMTNSQMAPVVSTTAHMQAVPVSMTIPSVNAVSTPTSTSYHCSQTVPGSFVTVSNVYSSQLQNDGMQQYGKTVGAPPVLQWQAVAADRPSAKKGFDGDAGLGSVTVSVTQPTAAPSGKPPLKAVPKGILKQREEDPTVIPAPRNRTAPGGASMRLNGRNVHVRDSVEMIKEHQKKKQASKPKKKKSVRFADMEYEESESSVEPSDDSENDENKRFFITSTKDGETPVTKERKTKSPRPISAQTSSSSDSIDPMVREPRSLSAGTQRSRLSLQPHPPSQPPSGRAAMLSNGLKNNKMATGTSESPEKTNSTNINNSAVEAAMAAKEALHASPEVIRGINGLSLSRTPTDDEISKLWQKVRLCLNNTHTSQAHSKSGTGEATPVLAPSTISHKYMDGQSIVAQLRVGGHTSTTGYVNFQREPKSRVRHKFSMAALNHYNNKKGGLLQQRRPSGSVVVSYVPKLMTSAPPGRSTVQQLGYRHMPQPRYGGTVATETCANHSSVTDSMASFLKAEELSGQPTMTESQIEDTLERSRQRQHAHSMLRRPSQKAPSALSLEEQQLLQSLERLNQRLQANEVRHVTSTRAIPNYHPKPPAFQEDSMQENLPKHAQAQVDTQARSDPHTGMFRGRPPLTAGYRRHKVNSTNMRQHPFHGGFIH